MFTCYLNQEHVIFQDLHQEVGFLGVLFLTVKGCLNVSHIQLTVSPLPCLLVFKASWTKGMSFHSVESCLCWSVVGLMLVACSLVPIQCSDCFTLFTLLCGRARQASTPPSSSVCTVCMKLVYWIWSSLVQIQDSIFHCRVLCIAVPRFKLVLLEWLLKIACDPWHCEKAH